MQLHRERYVQLTSAASAVERAGQYREAVRVARSAWPHIDGMLQFDRRYRDTTHETVGAVEIVLRCAPVLLDHRSLEALRALLQECKRIAREAVNYTDAIATAAVQLDKNHRLWSCLYENGEVIQGELQSKLGGDQDEWCATVDIWTAIGLVSRAPHHRSYLLSLATRFGQVVPAKCPHCGHTAEAPKSMFFEPLTCATCGSQSYFVISPS